MAAIKEEDGGVLQQTNSRNQDSKISQLEDGMIEMIKDKNIQHPRDGLPTWKWALTCGGLYIGALLYGLDTTIAADVQGSVYEALGEIQNLQWVGLGFPMASVAVILLMGRLYSLFNIKWLMVITTAIFEIGSAICGAAPTSDALIIGRVIAGIGGSGMYLGALSYFSVFTTNKEATLYNAGIGLAWGFGSILGPVIGGAFSDSSATWRWAFYINLPLAALMSPVYLFIFPSFRPNKDQTVLQSLKSIDSVGAVLNAVVFVLFMLVLTFGGSTWAWGSGPAIAVWVVWGVSLMLYILQQTFFLFTDAESRLFPLHLLKSRALVLVCVGTATSATAVAVTIYYVPLLFQFTRSDSALQAAVRLLPFIVFFIFFVMVAGGSMPVVQRYNLYYILGGALVVTGGALLFTITPETSVARIYGYEILVAAGAGLPFQNGYAIAAAKVAKHDRASAIGLINVAQIGFMALSLAAAGSLFQNLGYQSLRDALADFHYPDDYVRSALAGKISPIFKSADSDVVEVAVRAIIDTIRRVFGMLLGTGAVLLVSGLLMPWEKVNFDPVDED
ncbi:Efflux pump roqT [Trichoderma lentiforme]|uniref:Efflux pump roqT n=1 Tax=Trichoderma lentiforme TaxID=1567552 RepID=A0A9P5C8L4_9HYPO|nr:Efflux pump roqT [Trichoderma lentiforme]